MSHEPFALMNAQVISPYSITPGNVGVENGRILPVEALPPSAKKIDVAGKYLSPGFVDLHVHGGGGFDFMDLTPEAFRVTCQTHLRHGTTSLTPTSTVATTDDYDRFLSLCRQFRNQGTGGARVIGAHLYGPYFLRAARGCHPDAEFLQPELEHTNQIEGFDHTFPLSVTISPETPGTKEYVLEARRRGAHVNIGHSYATFEQVEQALEWGARHVDHLFCAMSDRARLRQEQTFPMRAGLMEATLYFDELTTEVIADGQHLNDSLLRLAYKFKGPNRLALVTDSMRAVDCPDGEYWFGPQGRGELVRKFSNVGVTRDGKALASGVMGMDHCVRTMWKATQAPLYEIIRMASLTPAKIIGLDAEIGSIATGKIADLLVLDREAQIQEVYLAGEKIPG